MKDVLDIGELVQFRSRRIANAKRTEKLALILGSSPGHRDRYVCWFGYGDIVHTDRRALVVMSLSAAVQDENSVKNDD